MAVRKQMTGKASRRGKALQKLRYDQLKKAGICVTCGKEKAIVDQIRCTYCKKKREESNRRYYLIRCRTKSKPIDYPPNGFVS